MKRNWARMTLSLGLVAMLSVSCSKKSTSDDMDTAGDISSIDTGSGAVGQRVSALPVVYFEYNSFALNSASREALGMAADWLKSNPGQKIQIEGHCDERGTTEYNLALGERRASAVRNYLTGRGVSASQLSTISYGEERPAAYGSDEASWAQNRRAEFVVGY